MRKQTGNNRMLGINSGRERRIAEGNRQELSLDRRAQVFRQDVPHSGNDGDPIRNSPGWLAQREAHEEKLRLAEPTIMEMHAAGATRAQMAEATGVSRDNVARILIRNGVASRGRRRW